ncbi:gastrotropin isoform 2-T3 [Liasis olivaceus]
MRKGPLLPWWIAVLGEQQGSARFITTKTFICKFFIGIPQKMSFTGKYEVENEENYDNFMKRLGLPDDAIEKGRNFKIISEIIQNNDEFTWSQIYPGGHILTNKFVIGKESEMETVGGKKFKAILRKEDGKVISDFPNYHYTAEIAGDKLIEISTVGDVIFKRISKKLS